MCEHLCTREDAGIIPYLEEARPRASGLGWHRRSFFLGHDCDERVLVMFCRGEESEKKASTGADARVGMCERRGFSRA